MSNYRTSQGINTSKLAIFEVPLIIAVQYQQAISSDYPATQQLRLLESQLTWLTYIIGAQIGGHMTMASTGREGHEKTDAVLGQGVFRLMQLSINA